MKPEPEPEPEPESAGFAAQSERATSPPADAATAPGVYIRREVDVPGNQVVGVSLHGDEEFMGVKSPMGGELTGNAQVST